MAARTGRTLLLVAMSAIAALPLPGLVEATVISARGEFAERPSATREYATIAAHLRRPFHGYGVKDVLLPQFGIVALSQMAMGLFNVYAAEPLLRGEVHALAEEVTRRALSASVSPWQRPTLPPTAMDDHNLFWSHLAVILGIERMMRCVEPPCRPDPDRDELEERIIDHLRARSLATGVFQAPSYPGSPLWPADQTVSLLALRLYDATHGTALLTAPLRGFVAWLQSHRDPATGLFPSSASPAVATFRVPRGCALSWSSSYWIQLDPDIAREQYVRERRVLRQDLAGLGGFREWPPGREAGSDLDSGPIVFGIGVAATGLGLGPARVFRDDDAYTVIRRSALVVGVPALWPSGGYLAAPLLGEAILFQGRTARPWFGPVATLEAHPAPAPTAPAILAALDLAVLAALALAALAPFRGPRASNGPTITPRRP